MLDDLFLKYKSIVRQADFLFNAIQEKYPACVQCKIHCCDCCHAFFGVFPVEAAYINFHFNRSERKIKREILRGVEKTETQMLKTWDKLQVFDDKPEMKIYGLGKEKVKCPFLTDKKECILYEIRPVICRIYGVPFSMNDGKKEKVYVCPVSGFEEKVSYPTVKLDKVYHKLCQLSGELLRESGSVHQEKAVLMLPLAKVVKMPLETIIKGDFGE